MSRDPRLNLNDILDRIDRIERYTSRGHNSFMQSELRQDAVIRSFEVIGEAVKRLDKTLIAQQPQVAWKDFAGFRDVLIHQYELTYESLLGSAYGAIDNILADQSYDEDCGTYEYAE